MVRSQAEVKNWRTVLKHAKSRGKTKRQGPTYQDKVRCLKSVAKGSIPEAEMKRTIQNQKAETGGQKAKLETEKESPGTRDQDRSRRPD